MPKRVIDFDAMWGSDKLAACCLGAGRVRMAVWTGGCVRLLRADEFARDLGRVAAVRGNFTIERLEQVFAEFQDKGLLFVWEYEGKRYGHWTGSDVPGRLPLLRGG